MDPLTMIALMNAALSVIETLGPKIQDMMNKNEITPQQQTDLLNRLSKLRGGDLFTSPHWQPSGIPKTPIK